ncbi:hypothetical protein GCM10008171_05470 [Methylopila jiangsuensis]|uniref:DUF3253 domain-containing protein n=1 Tax=Methylopila jiangsuensis TaxID=586230 RepID=A0A9W6JGU7_9HYPH|nr:DUF3253 domain-containing protein [Methylopila jiangsuensis]MDR6285535.1 hypothetical protein [Methylopila jiangsuensis]GLK75293.1 hypothetical protein GCM10008171_05470 [Methylopila jiangsuensis]
MSETIEDLLFRLAAERGPGKTLDPSEVAKAAAEQRGEEDWHKRLTDVRAAAVRLARRGRLAVYRKGKPADPETFKGVYRIGLPPADGAAMDDAESDEAVGPGASPSQI